ncbi:hypothetical protein [Paenibacillus sp. FSL K6-2524]|uniref:hypothetical protein n=1 Tax=Paenibacillus sp. FSL K6-2524 TaxID=2954516 RepID=UPI0030F69152
MNHDLHFGPCIVVLAAVVALETPQKGQEEDETGEEPPLIFSSRPCICKSQKMRVPIQGWHYLYTKYSLPRKAVLSVAVYLVLTIRNEFNGRKTRYEKANCHLTYSTDTAVFLHPRLRLMSVRRLRFLLQL